MHSEISSEMLAAMEWLVRLNDEQAAPDLAQQFDTWLDAAAANRDAWRQANALWSGLEPVKTEYDAMRRRDGLVSRRYALAGIAATAMASTVLWQAVRPRLGADYITAAGETQAVTLADGSLVNLGSRSAFAVDFDAGHRRLQLLRGEAFFSVASKDPRPFIVSAMKGRILTYDAGFNVNSTPACVQVAVASSTVSLLPPNHQALTLSAGWRARYDAEHLYPALQVDITSVGVWRQGRLVFENTPLREVLAEIERWRGGRIAVLDAKTAETPVSAIFDAAKPQMALDTVVETLKLRRTDLPGGISLIYA